MLPAVAELLLLSVAVGCVGRGAILLPVIRMAVAPLPWTVATDLPVFGIGCNLPPVILSSALTLADRFATDHLARLKLRRLKGLLAVAAKPFPHKSRCRTALSNGNRKRGGPISG